ncbi:MAG TPA: hypothetical protein VEA99_07975 [Gemmatimonadaceae bacterium]|nr:hypothetical protein [Gemmatimonadaceae bacterium]
MTATASAAHAQTDYYNTDAGRPITVEDATPIERRAFELQLAPLRLERSAGGRYSWGVEPEMAFGILPRTQIELAVPLALIDAPTGRRAGLAGIELSALHNLNVETRIPAFAVAADLLLPVGGFAPARAYPSVKGIATRTFRWARFHANAQYTMGEAPALDEEPTSELSRWLAGVAVDRAFPLRSLLVTAEVTTEQPMHDEEELEWSAATGLRYQYSPRWAIDAGVGKRLTGTGGSWYLTFGSAYAFGLPWRGR